MSSRSSAPPPQAAYAPEEPTLGEYLAIILQSRVLIGSVVAAALVLAGAYILLAAPTFRSDVLLQVEDKSKGLAGLDDLADTFSQKDLADTEIEIIRSRSLLGSVVDELNLTIEARPRTFPVFGGAFFRHHRGVELAGSFLGLRSFAWGGERIRVTRLEVPDELLDDRLVLTAADGGKFTLAGPDGVLLAGEAGKPAADHGAEIFVADLRAKPGTRFKVVKRRRAGVIDDLQTDLRISEKGKKTGVITVALEGKDPEHVASILDAIARAYLRQNVERKSAEAAKTLDFLEHQLPDLRKNLDTTGASLKTYQLQHHSADLDAEMQAMLDRGVELEKTLTEIELNRSELRQRFTDSHPALLALKEKEQKLRNERAALETKIRALPDQQFQSIKLNRDAKVASELYFLVLNKAQEMNVLKSGTIGNVRILDTALRPWEPVSPKKLPVMALALLLGLAGGIGAAFARKALDQGLEDPAEVESAAGITVYSTVPLSAREQELTRVRERSPAVATVLAAADPADLAVESLRSLRTALQFALVDAHSNLVMISGASPEVGKTFLTVNLGHVLASTGKRVLIVDADLRRGSLHRYLGGKRPGGVSEVVSGEVALAAAVRKTPLETLDYVSTGKLPPNPSEMVGSPRFKAFLTEACAHYDLVVVDTPPILAVTDAALIGRYSGVNVLVLRAGRHPIREIVLALKQFSEAGVTMHGAVMNALSVAAGASRYGYQQHFQYAYRPEGKDD